MKKFFLSLVLAFGAFLLTPSASFASTPTPTSTFTVTSTPTNTPTFTASPTRTPVPLFPTPDRWDTGNLSASIGGKLQARAIIFEGNRPGVLAGTGLPVMNAEDGRIELGEAVSLKAVTVIAGVKGYALVPVERSTTEGQYIVGLTVKPGRYRGDEFLVQTTGLAVGIAETSVTIGDELCASTTTAGALVRCSTQSGSAATTVSRSAVVGVAAESHPAGFVRVLLKN